MQLVVGVCHRGARHTGAVQQLQDGAAQEVAKKEFRQGKTADGRHNATISTRSCTIEVCAAS